MAGRPGRILSRQSAPLRSGRAAQLAQRGAARSAQTTDAGIGRLQRAVGNRAIHRLFRSPLSNASPQVRPGLASYLAGSEGNGQPLAPSTRRRFEPRLAHDFGAVRVHADARAATAAAELGAQAFTLGSDMYFGAGRLQPGTAQGDRLLAHELAHVVQGGGGTIRRKAETAADTPRLRFEPAVNQPPCACVVFMHNDERKARKTARLMHANCRYNLAMVQDPEGLKDRNIKVPKHGEKDPNSLFPADIVNACMSDDKACRDYLDAKKTSTKADEILGFAQRQYFLAVKDCSNAFSLPVVALHNNALGDTERYRRDMAKKGVADLKLDVDKGEKATGSDVLDTIRKRIKEKFGAVGVKQTLDTAKTTNIYRWCQSEDIQRCHIGDPEHPDNVVWTTNPDDFERLQKASVNVVLETQRPKPPSSESAGDLSTMFVLLGLRLADQWAAQARIVGRTLEDELVNTLRSLLLVEPKPVDPDARLDALLAMVRLARERRDLRFINIETGGSTWGKEAERVANFRALTAVLDGLGLHCCDVTGKGDAAVEAGLKGDDE